MTAMSRIEARVLFRRLLPNVPVPETAQGCVDLLVEAGKLDGNGNIISNPPPERVKAGGGDIPPSGAENEDEYPVREREKDAREVQEAVEAIAERIESEGVQDTDGNVPGSSDPGDGGGDVSKPAEAPPGPVREVLMVKPAAGSSSAPPKKAPPKKQDREKKESPAPGAEIRKNAPVEPERPVGSGAGADIERIMLEKLQAMYWGYLNERAGGIYELLDQAGAPKTELAAVLKDLSRKIAAQKLPVVLDKMVKDALEM